MGAGNVALLYARWSHLHHRTFRLVGFMALTALDDDPEPRYWGGHEPLCAAIGRRNLPSEPAAGDQSAHARTVRKLRRAALEAVKDSVRDGTDKGVISLAQRARPGRNAVYRLHLDAAASKRTGQVETPPSGQAEHPPFDMLSLSMGGAEPVDGGVSNPSRGVVGGVGTEEEPKSPRVPTSPAAAITYARARSILEALPDLGAAHVARIPDGGDLKGRVIAAALLCLTERNAGTGT